MMKVLGIHNLLFIPIITDANLLRNNTDIQLYIGVDTNCGVMMSNIITRKQIFEDHPSIKEIELENFFTKPLMQRP